MTRSTPRHWQPATTAVHAGEQAEPGVYRPVSTPIHHAATYLYDTTDQLDAAFENRSGFVYTRQGNPTVQALETALAALEGAGIALATASGMAALHAALLACELAPGDRLVASQDLYGTSASLLNTIFAAQGVEVRYVDVNDRAATERALAGGQARVLLIEILSNPLLRVADLPALSHLAHQHDARLVVDATFTPPVLLRTLEHGADLAVHSTTKYLGGHGDVLGGVVVAGADFATSLRTIGRLVGGVPGPTEAWLTLRGLKTLPLRYERQSENAAAIAAWLAARPEVSAVHYPGLPSHPGHDLAARLFAGSGRRGQPSFGAMVAFELRAGDRAAAGRFLDRLELCLPATSLGDVYTLIAYPAIASHRDVPAPRRARLGIGDGLLRLSAGIEALDDILADLDQALAAV